MAESDNPQTLEQFKARMDCRTGVQMRVSSFLNKPEHNEKTLETDMEETPRVGGRISSWQKRESYAKKVRDNVFSEQYRPGVKVANHEYGTPEAGSLTDKRGRQAGQRISNEVWELCEIIRELGQQTGPNTWAITFGHLFETYTRISNKVVGMLMRARRQKLVDFEGEMLFQGRDNDVIITLLKHPNDIEGVESVRQTVIRKS